MNIEECSLAINSLGSNFDSHDLIREYFAKFPASYGDLLKKYNDVNLAHAEISNYLRINSDKLKIQKIGEITSEDIFGNMTVCASWAKIKD